MPFGWKKLIDLSEVKFDEERASAISALETISQTEYGTKFLENLMTLYNGDESNKIKFIFEKNIILPTGEFSGTYYSSIENNKISTSYLNINIQEEKSYYYYTEDGALLEPLLDLTIVHELQHAYFDLLRCHFNNHTPEIVNNPVFQDDYKKIILIEKNLGRGGEELEAISRANNYFSELGLPTRRSHNVVDWKREDLNYFCEGDNPQSYVYRMPDNELENLKTSIKPNLQGRNNFDNLIISQIKWPLEPAENYRLLSQRLMLKILDKAEEMNSSEPTETPSNLPNFSPKRSF